MNNQPTSDLAYRFEYADKSAFEVYVDGRAFIAFKDGRREERHGTVTNNIPLLLGKIAKPRQDEIDRLRAEVAQWRRLVGDDHSITQQETKT